MKPTSKNVRIIDISKEFHDIILDDFGLTPEDFVQSDNNSSYIHKESYVKKQN